MFETQAFPKHSGTVTHCRNHCWMVILPMKVTLDQDKHLSTIVIRQVILHCCHFQQAGKRLQWEKGTQRPSPTNSHTSNVLAVVVTSWTRTRDRDYCTVFTITPKITAKYLNKWQTLAYFLLFKAK